jgi:hypothetical protein
MVPVGAARLWFFGVVLIVRFLDFARKHAEGWRRSGSRWRGLWISVLMVSCMLSVRYRYGGDTVSFAFVAFCTVSSRFGL